MTDENFQKIVRQLQIMEADLINNSYARTAAAIREVLNRIGYEHGDKVHKRSVKLTEQPK